MLDEDDLVEFRDAGARKVEEFFKIDDGADFAPEIDDAEHEWRGAGHRRQFAQPGDFADFRERKGVALAGKIELYDFEGFAGRCIGSEFPRKRLRAAFQNAPLLVR